MVGTLCYAVLELLFGHTAGSIMAHELLDRASCKLVCVCANVHARTLIGRVATIGDAVQIALWRNAITPIHAHKKVRRTSCRM
jgi:hypothetical protein